MKLRSIQVLRAIAATAVVVNHSTEFPIGRAGVDLFFVVSGIIIGTVMVGRTAGEFAAARVWRIFPIYYFCLIPWLAVAVTAGMIEPGRLASTLTLWPVWGEWQQPYLTLAWTLCFEMFFYAVTTGALAVGKTSLIVPFLSSLIGANFLFGGPLLNFVGNPIILEFCAGLLILRLPKHSVIGAIAVLAGVILFATAPLFAFDGAELMPFDRAWFRVIHWGIPAALMAYGALSLEGWFKGRASDPLVAIGDASYSLYLSHYLIAIALPVWWPVKVLVCILVSLAMFRWVERPVMRWRKSIRLDRSNSTAMPHAVRPS